MLFFESIKIASCFTISVLACFLTFARNCPSEQVWSIKYFISTMNSGKKLELSNIEKEMVKIAARKEKIENEYMDDKISADAYNNLLDCCENEFMRLQMRKESLTTDTKESLENLRSALLVHKTVTYLYKNGDVKGKRKSLVRYLRIFSFLKKESIEPPNSAFWHL